MIEWGIIFIWVSFMHQARCWELSKALLGTALPVKEFISVFPWESLSGGWEVPERNAVFHFVGQPIQNGVTCHQRSSNQDSVLNFITVSASPRNGISKLVNLELPGQHKWGHLPNRCLPSLKESDLATGSPLCPGVTSSSCPSCL